jgi:hypothetical protein
MDFSPYAKLDDIKLMAGGRPDKMAHYAVKKKEFEDLKAVHFNDDHPFVDSFDESHLETLKQLQKKTPTMNRPRFVTSCRQLGLPSRNHEKRRI